MTKKKEANSPIIDLDLDHILNDKPPSEMSIEEILEDPEYFIFVPQHLKDQQVCERAVLYCGSNLQYVPDELKTPELCRIAIKSSPFAIMHIPDEMKSQNLYMNLVQEDPQNLKGIPSEERTYEMCQMAFDNTYGKNKDDYSIVGALNSPELVLRMIREVDSRQKLSMLMNALYLNQKVVTNEVIQEVMKKSGWELQFLPSQVITQEIAKTAVEQNPDTFLQVPVELRTPDMYLYAIKNCSNPNINIPENILTRNNICSFAQKIEARLKQSFSYNEHKRLYAGEAIEVKNVSVEGKNIENCIVFYARSDDKLILQEVTPRKNILQTKTQTGITLKKSAKRHKL